MKNEIKPRLKNHIQILRGISVIAIVLFHSANNPNFFGYLGVDIFFVISGFVITPKLIPILSEHKFSKRFHLTTVFMFRRFFRLAPALGVFLAFSCFSF